MHSGFCPHSNPLDCDADPPRAKVSAQRFASSYIRGASFNAESPETWSRVLRRVLCDSEGKLPITAEVCHFAGVQSPQRHPTDVIQGLSVIAVGGMPEFTVSQPPCPGDDDEMARMRALLAQAAQKEKEARA